jgi:hypothetical protein
MVACFDSISFVLPNVVKKVWYRIIYYTVGCVKSCKILHGNVDHFFGLKKSFIKVHA